MDLVRAVRIWLGNFERLLEERMTVEVAGG